MSETTLQYIAFTALLLFLCTVVVVLVVYRIAKRAGVLNGNGNIISQPVARRT